MTEPQYQDEIWIDQESGARLLWQRHLKDDSYTAEQAKELHARWGERVGEISAGARLVWIAPTYIDDMRRALDQHEFTAWYLWKFPRPAHRQSAHIHDDVLTATQLELLPTD